MWDTILIAARFLQFAGALVLLGSSLFCVYGLRPNLPPLSMPARWQWPRSALIVSAIVALAGTVLWVMAETVLFSENPSDGTRPSAVWTVFSETRFGRVCLARIALLATSLAATIFITKPMKLWRIQVALGSVIVASFAWTGHGAMTSGGPGVVHLAGDLVHLWGAAVWFGALLPIAILIRRARRSGSPDDARAAQYGLGRFSAIGTGVVAAIVASGIVNSAFLIGFANWRSLFATAYGNALLVKVGLFLLMLTLAAANRFRLTPQLQNALAGEGRTSSSLEALNTSILIEIGLALLVLAAIGVLGTLAPANISQ